MRNDDCRGYARVWSAILITVFYFSFFLLAIDKWEGTNGRNDVAPLHSTSRMFGIAARRAFLPIKHSPPEWFYYFFFLFFSYKLVVLEHVLSPLYVEITKYERLLDTLREVYGRKI